jgi:hypothetical protein
MILTKSHDILLGSGIFNIEGIIHGDNNDLWISQLGGGLVHFDKATAKYRIFTTADGLSNNTCYGLLKDKTGQPLDFNQSRYFAVQPQNSTIQGFWAGRWVKY